MVGVPWEQHIAFLEERYRPRSIETRVRHGIRACAGHPAILCYAIGNEIPASLVRWYGHRHIERFLRQLYGVAKAEDPEGLVTYVNYPTTEYLQLPCLDLVCFNVYLESRARFEAYLARLQNLTGDRPLVMSEIGLDSRRHGEAVQAHVLDWQVRAAFAAGCAGAFVFAWTDEWHRDGYDIADWDFGLTDRQRRPKPALNAVSKAFAEVPFPPDLPWPRISVIVCTYNGARTIQDCLEGLAKLAYPDFEVIVVNDGSTDATAAMVQPYGFRLISTANCGLSSARNTGLEAATGDIVAYIDDDAYPDPHWLTYLAATFLQTPHAGVGGPNLAPPGDGFLAACVANAPGGPVEVLLSNQEAEHLPGCNMAFRKTALQAIGGFDRQFRTAGDDVDCCWRLQQQGWTLGFHAAAMVWHHRRNGLRAYWKQQQGYSKAEALLEKKWPEKYNGLGHLAWAGRLYGPGSPQAVSWRRGRIYQGIWGSALFQALYQPVPSTFWSLALMPEWYLVIIALVALSALGVLWKPLLLTLPFLAFAVSVPLVQAGLSATRVSFPSPAPSPVMQLKLRMTIAVLHLLQPLARLSGRLCHGLTPWRWRCVRQLARPWPRTLTLWSEWWQSATERLQALEALLRADNASIRRGGDFDRWDLEVRGGLFGAVQTLLAVEEHGAGRQLVRFHAWPKCSKQGYMLTLLFAALATGAAFDDVWIPAGILGTVAVLLAWRTFQECAGAMAAVLRALKHLGAGERLRQRMPILLSTASLLCQARLYRPPHCRDFFARLGDDTPGASRNASSRERRR
jgi:GT2 family glycosyltransferase